MSSLDGTLAPGALAAGLEVLTGTALIAAPSPLARLLFGSELDATGDVLARICGIVILCLAAGCWPRSRDAFSNTVAPLFALNLLATAFLVYVGVVGTRVGVLLWPAAAAHLILTVLLARAWRAGAHAAS
jgi:hypothetical protein